MFISDIVRRSGRSLRQAKARTLLTAAAIAVGTFALTLTLAASNGAQSFVNKIITDNFDPAELIVANDEGVFGRADNTKPREFDDTISTSVVEGGAVVQYKRLTDADVAKIKALPEVERLREGINLNFQYLTRPGQKKYVGSAQAFSEAQNPELLAGKLVKPLAARTILLPEAYITSLGFKNAQEAIGQQLTIAVRKPFDQQTAQSALSGQGVPSADQLKALNDASTLEEKYTITAVMKKPTTSQPGTELYMFIGDDDARRLNDFSTKDTPDYRKYTYAFVRVKDGNNKEKLVAAQNKLKGMGYSTQSVEDTQKFLTNIIGVLRGIVAAFGAIAVIASVFGIVNTMYISVLQRTREIGLMKALGMRKRDIGRLFRFEAAWIGFIGGLIGSLGAFALGTSLNPWITEKLELGTGTDLLIFKLPQIVTLIVALMVVATLAGLLPSRKAAKLDPIEALRTE